MKKEYKRALLIEYFTVGYNIIEAVASIVAGGMANSIALIGFGLDSIVESLAGLVMIWRLMVVHKNIPEEEEEKIEKRASSPIIDNGNAGPWVIRNISLGKTSI